MKTPQDQGRGKGDGRGFPSAIKSCSLTQMVYTTCQNIHNDSPVCVDMSLCGDSVNK